MSVVKHASLVIPLIPAAHGDRVAWLDRHSPRQLKVVRDEKRLPESGADDETLMPRRTHVVVEDLLDPTGDSEDQA